MSVHVLQYVGIDELQGYVLNCLVAFFVDTGTEVSLLCLAIWDMAELQ